MDPNKTAPFDLGPRDDGASACLLIHGFTGSPWDMLPLGEALAARGHRALCPRLPGHGTTPEAMEQVTHRDWEEAVEAELLGLSHHASVFVGGLSVGALLSVWLAARHPERVRGLALLAPAMQFIDPTMRLARLVRRFPLLETVRPWIAKNGTDLQDAEALAQAPILSRFPSARLFDLWAVQEKAKAVLGKVRAPALVMVAVQDHVVSVAGGRALSQGLTSASTVRFVELTQGFHILPRDKGRALVAEEVCRFFDGLAPQPR
jgi:carboxylesterase